MTTSENNGRYFCAEPKDAFEPHSLSLYRALDDVFGGNVTDPSRVPTNITLFTEKVNQRMGYLKGVLSDPRKFGITSMYALAALEEFYIVTSVHSFKTAPLLEQKTSGRIEYDPLKEIRRIVKEYLTGTDLKEDALKKHAIEVQGHLGRHINVAESLPDFVEEGSDVYNTLDSFYRLIQRNWEHAMRRIKGCTLTDFAKVQTPSERYVQNHLPSERTEVKL